MSRFTPHLITFKKALDKHYINMGAVGGMSVQKTRYWCLLCQWQLTEDLADRIESVKKCVKHLEQIHIYQITGFTKKMRLLATLNRILDK